MKICICGPSGAGKTTLTKALAMVNENHTVLVIDDLVRELYKTEDMLEYIGIQIGADSTVEDWKKHIIDNTFDRGEFEEYLWQRYIKHEIDKHDDIVVDGLLPYAVERYNFDQVVYVTAPKAVRKEHLLKRGVMPDRVTDIMKIQSPLFGGIDRHLL